MNKKEEIFTIGDKTNNGTISKFEVDSNGIRVFFEEKPKNYHVSLNSVQKVKQPIFQTEDGVDIFKDDNYYQITSNFDYVKCIAFDKNNFDKSLIIFSTKEKAEEYIIMNKPCLSLNDIDFAISKTNNAEEKRNKLKELIKSKI